MLISDQIAELFDAMLAERDGILEIRRNEMAERLGCSPSQINYVIASRFSPERGYVTVSRRGGGGYIRIERKRFPNGRLTLMHAVLSVGPTIGAEDGTTGFGVGVATGVGSASPARVEMKSVDLCSSKTAGLPSEPVLK